MYQEEVVPSQVEPLCYISKRPWKNQGFNTQAYAQPSQNNWDEPMPWKPWPQPWAQG